LLMLVVGPSGSTATSTINSCKALSSVNHLFHSHEVRIGASPLHCQSQNGAIKRYWQTAIVMAHSFLIEAKLPNYIGSGPPNKLCSACASFPAAMVPTPRNSQSSNPSHHQGVLYTMG
jgi:hypothetical protein